MPAHALNDEHEPVAIPPIVDQHSWEAALDELRAREKAATRELDAIAAARRRLPMVELPDYTLEGANGAIRLADAAEDLAVASGTSLHRCGANSPRLPLGTGR